MRSPSVKMIFHGSASQFPLSPLHEYIKQEDYNLPLPLYATPTIHDVGAVRRDTGFAEGRSRGLVYRTASSISRSIEQQNFTASSAAMPSQKRPVPAPDANGDGTPTKHIKAEHPEEFSNAVKKRLASSTRTGQACDRCKVKQNFPLKSHARTC